MSARQKTIIERESCASSSACSAGGSMVRGGSSKRRAHGETARAAEARRRYERISFQSLEPLPPYRHSKN